MDFVQRYRRARQMLVFGHFVFPGPHFFSAVRNMVIIGGFCTKISSRQTDVGVRTFRLPWSKLRRSVDQGRRNVRTPTSVWRDDIFVQNPPIMTIFLTAEKKCGPGKTKCPNTNICLARRYLCTKSTNYDHISYS